MAENTTEKRVAELERQVASMWEAIKDSNAELGKTRIRYEAASRALTTFKGRFDRALERLEAFDAHRTEAFLEYAKKDALLVHQGYRSFIVRVTILTELWRLVRQRPPQEVYNLVMSLVHAMDEPNSWWLARRELTLGEWRDLLKTYRAPKPSRRQESTELARAIDEHAPKEI